MKDISTRYGASVELNATVDDVAATSASLYVGLPGQAPVITQTGSFVDGVADLSLTPVKTRVPLATYKYQVNVTYSDGRVKKFPDPSTCNDDEFPEFTIAEALDETEVT